MSKPRIVKRDKIPVTKTLTVEVPKIAVTVKGSGYDGTHYGDIVIDQVFLGDKFKIADKLRSLADIIVATDGYEIQSGKIVVLIRAKDPK